jgi:hypothetical protein
MVAFYASLIIVCIFCLGHLALQLSGFTTGADDLAAWWYASCLAPYRGCHVGQPEYCHHFDYYFSSNYRTYLLFKDLAYSHVDCLRILLYLIGREIFGFVWYSAGPAWPPLSGIISIVLICLIFRSSKFRVSYGSWTSLGSGRERFAWETSSRGLCFAFCATSLLSFITLLLVWVVSVVSEILLVGPA